MPIKLTNVPISEPFHGESSKMVLETIISIGKSTVKRVMPKFGSSLSGTGSASAFRLSKSDSMPLWIKRVQIGPPTAAQIMHTPKPKRITLPTSAPRVAVIAMAAGCGGNMQ